MDLIHSAGALSVSPAGGWVALGHGRTGGFRLNESGCDRFVFPDTVALNRAIMVDE